MLYLRTVLLFVQPTPSTCSPVLGSDSHAPLMDSGTVATGTMTIVNLPADPIPHSSSVLLLDSSTVATGTISTVSPPEVGSKFF